MIKEISSFLFSIVLVTLLFIFIWKQKIGLINFLFIILVFILVDLDHFFLTEKIGFGRIPDPGTLIFQLHHTIEFYIFIILLNIPFTNFRSSLIDILFIKKDKYKVKWKYNYLKIARTLFLGVTIHYIMDLIIYPISGKLGYYYYSIIQYLL